MKYNAGFLQKVLNKLLASSFIAFCLLLASCSVQNKQSLSPLSPYAPGEPLVIPTPSPTPIPEFNFEDYEALFNELLHANPEEVPALIAANPIPFFSPEAPGIENVNPGQPLKGFFAIDIRPLAKCPGVEKIFIYLGSLDDINITSNDWKLITKTDQYPMVIEYKDHDGKTQYLVITNRGTSFVDVIRGAMAGIANQMNQEYKDNKINGAPQTSSCVLSN